MRERTVPENPYPYADTIASGMLRTAVERAGQRRGLSLRGLAKQLGYKQATVLSHMANGRIPVPLERATDIAEALEIPAADFFRAAVAQRNPAAMHLLEPHGAAAEEGARMNMVTQLVELSGGALDDLTEGQKEVLREVVLDRNAARRWLSPAEIPLILLLRRLRPELSREGLKSHDLSAIERALS
jgi:Helix-turn-helix.